MSIILLAVGVHNDMDRSPYQHVVGVILEPNQADSILCYYKWRRDDKPHAEEFSNENYSIDGYILEEVKDLKWITELEEGE